jgi:hypothetical protein
MGSFWFEDFVEKVLKATESSWSRNGNVEQKCPDGNRWRVLVKNFSHNWSSVIGEVKSLGSFT